MIPYIWLVVLFPLLGVIINGLAGIKLPRKLIGTIGSLAILGSFITASLIFKDLIGQGVERASEVVLFTWIGCGSIQVNVGFLVDPAVAGDDAYRIRRLVYYSSLFHRLYG